MPLSQSRILWMAIAVAFFLVIAFIIANNLKNSTAVAATSYATSAVRRGEVESLVSAPARLNAINEVDLSFQVSGVISDVAVKTGDIVQQGQVLARLDSRELELNASAVQASLRQAQARLEGVKTGSARDLATAQANLRAAQAKVQLAKSGNVPPDDLKAAQADLDQAQSRYNTLQARPNPKDVQAAEATVKQAQAKLEQAKLGPNSQTVQGAEAELDVARNNFNKVFSGSNAAKEQARINQEQAQRAFDSAKASYDKIYGENHNPDGTLKPGLPGPALDAEKNAKNALDDAKGNLDKAKSANTDAQSQAESGQKEAQSKVNQAQANLDKVKATAQGQQKEVTAAQAEVERAQAALERARQGATRNELDAALAEINGARARLDKLNKSAVSEKEVGLAQAEADKAQAAVDSLSKGPSAAELSAAQAAVEEAEALSKRAQLRLGQVNLQAPFTGVIGMVRLAAGQNTGSDSPVLTLLDLSALKAELLVPESEISRIRVGQVARFSLEAVPDLKDLRGRINRIAPKASVGSGGTTGYAVMVLLDKSAKPDSDPLALGVKPGMTSNVRLVVEAKADVLVAPRRAVKTIGGNPAVEVLSGTGQIFTVPVTLGVKGDKEVEIIEPALLLPGDLLVLSSNPVNQGVVTSLEPATSPKP